MPNARAHSKTTRSEIQKQLTRGNLEQFNAAAGAWKGSTRPARVSLEHSLHNQCYLPECI